MQQVPQQGVSLFADAIELVVREKTRSFALLSNRQSRRGGGQTLLLTERGHRGQLMLLLQGLGKLKHVLVVGILVFEIVQILVRLVGQPGEKRTVETIITFEELITFLTDVQKTILK